MLATAEPQVVVEVSGLGNAVQCRKQRAWIQCIKERAGVGTLWPLACREHACVLGAKAGFTLPSTSQSDQIITRTHVIAA